MLKISSFSFLQAKKTCVDCPFSKSTWGLSSFLIVSVDPSSSSTVLLYAMGSSEIRQEMMAEIDTSRQIVFAPEEPAYELTVFTDIDCGYCRKLHDQVAEYNEEGISIRYMAYPRAGIGSRSYEKAVTVWCADDPQAAMTSAKAGEEMVPIQCDNPVAEQYQLGQAMGVSGTPALLTSDGQLIPGYVPPAQLRARLDRMNAQVAAE